VPGQALYLARINMMSAYKDLTDALPSRIGGPAVGLQILRLDQPLDHMEVLETAERVKGQFIGLLKALIPRIAEAIA